MYVCSALLILTISSCTDDVVEDSRPIYEEENAYLKSSNGPEKNITPCKCLLRLVDVENAPTDANGMFVGWPLFTIPFNINAAGHPVWGIGTTEDMLPLPSDWFEPRGSSSSTGNISIRITGLFSNIGMLRSFDPNMTVFLEQRCSVWFGTREHITRKSFSLTMGDGQSFPGATVTSTLFKNILFECIPNPDTGVELLTECC